MSRWTWVIEHWRTWGISALFAAFVGYLKIFYDLRKARSDALASEIARQKAQRALAAEKIATANKAIDDKIYDALGRGTAMWGQGVITGGGDRGVRSAEIADRLSIDVNAVVESLERLEAKRRVSNQGGTMDNPAPYWVICRK